MGVSGYRNLSYDPNTAGSGTAGSTGDYRLSLEQLGTIRGVKWNDRNGNGVRDPLEEGLADWKIYLDDDRDGEWTSGEPFQLTTSTGEYVFTQLSAGDYIVGEIPQTGWQQTLPGASGAAQKASSSVQLAGGAVANVPGGGEEIVVARNPESHRFSYAEPAVQESASLKPIEPATFSPAFDLRTLGKVTSVKDQGACGSCWSFATYGSLESSILMEGGAVRDFSENHLKDSHGFDLGPCDGGNTYMSTAYLTRGSGPVNESDDPYHDWDDRPSPGGPPQYYVRETLTFDSDDEIKTALVNYGALYTSMGWYASAYRSSDFTYYYSGTGSTNHGVTIVGWDDNKATAAPTPGAWLIKNSWGTAWGNQGYFWLSYADTRGGNSAVSYRDAVDADTYATVYAYDRFGDTDEWNVSYAFNAFTATTAEDLAAVQFFTMADNAGYEVRIYDTFSGGALGSLLATVSGTAAYAGSHTVDLPSAVRLTPGDNFYVYLHITNGGSYPMAAESAWQGYSSAATASPGQSYLSTNGVSWNDLTNLDATGNICIKALTKPMAIPGTKPVSIHPGETVAAVDFGGQRESVSVVDRRIFYNNSSFDAGGDDLAAVAPSPAELTAAGKDPNLGKEALLPGGTATFKNYISYSKGINGIILNVLGLRATSLSASDFTFKVGNDDNPLGWATGASPSVAVGLGVGPGGSDQITLVWPDNAIPNGNWLQVTLKTETSGLAAPDVFYFGCAMGETGNNAWGAVPDGKVSSLDAALTRLNNSAFAAVGIENIYDFNRDAVVNSFDAALCRLGNSLLNPLKLIQTPTTAPMATFASAPSAMRNAAFVGSTSREMLYSDLAYSMELSRTQKQRASLTHGSMPIAVDQVFAQYYRV